MQKQSGDKLRDDLVNQDDDINLFEIWEILVKRKYLILSVFIASIMLAVLYIFLIKPEYQSQAIVQIGEIGFGLDRRTNFIEDPKTLVQSLPQRYSGLSVTLTADNILLLSFNDKTAQNAYVRLHRVVSDLFQRHQILFNQVTSLRKSRLNALKNKLAASNLNTLQRAELEDQIAQTELLMTEVYTRPTQIIQAASLNSHPVNSNKNLYLVLSGILGLMGGIISAFCAEFFVRLKANTQKGL